MSCNFNSYARYYDRIYQNRDYSNFTKTIVDLLKKHGAAGGRVLDLGCGTATQSLFFERLGYSYTGVDRSPEMIQIAKEKFPDRESNFLVSEISRLNLNHKFEVIVSLFHVLSYQTENEQLMDFFKAITRHMNENSVAYVDFWSGPAVREQGPQVSQKTFQDKDGVLKKMVAPLTSSSFPVFELDVQVEELQDNIFVETVKEKHTMRCFFPEELEEVTRRAGLIIIEKSIHKDEWNGYIVLRRGDKP
jgi:SAM-dependent methyltransferase